VKGERGGRVAVGNRKEWQRQVGSLGARVLPREKNLEKKKAKSKKKPVMRTRLLKRMDKGKKTLGDEVLVWWGNLRAERKEEGCSSNGRPKETRDTGKYLGLRERASPRRMKKKLEGGAMLLSGKADTTAERMVPRAFGKRERGKDRREKGEKTE